MGKYGGATPKPHKIWSNDKALLDAIHAEAGHMSMEERRALSGESLVKKYVDWAGRTRCTGIKSKLQKSQRLVWKRLYVVVAPSSGHTRPHSGPRWHRRSHSAERLGSILVLITRTTGGARAMACDR